MGLKKYNVYGKHDTGSIWEDELDGVGLSDIDRRRIEGLAVGASVTDQSDAVWYRVA